MVILALLLGHAAQHSKNAPARSGSVAPSALAPVSVPAPPSDPGAVTPCTKVLTALPVQLGELAPRIVHPTPDSPFVVAWGDPAVVLRCGVVRPNVLSAGSSEFVLGVNGVYFVQATHGRTHVFTAIDRVVYIEIAVPGSYPQPPLGPIAAAIAHVLPAVCVVDPKQADATRLCTNRK